MKKTALYDTHVAANGRIIHFGDWLMPVSYSSLTEEHNTVRTKVGLFDVSHMGEFLVTGEKATDFLDHFTPNRVKRLKIGRAHYTNLLTDKATIVDDLLIYKLKEQEYLLVVNALNTDKDLAYIMANRWPGAHVENKSSAFSQLALQGPKALPLMETFCGKDLADMRHFSFFLYSINGQEAIISRTGYTGEDGFEIYLPWSLGPHVWDKLMDLGAAFDIKPCGLGARDSLRLEAALPLYGNDIDETTTPIEADLGWIVKLKKGEFLGRDILLQQKEQGPAKKLTGFEVTGRGIPRKGYKILADGKEIGHITSGTKSPYTQRAIAMGYIPPAYTEPGREVLIQIRKHQVPARVVSRPFFEKKEA